MSRGGAARFACDSPQAQLWAWGASSGLGLPCGSLNHNQLRIGGEHLLHAVACAPGSTFTHSALPRLHATNGTSSSPIKGHIAGHFWVWQLSWRDAGFYQLLQDSVAHSSNGPALLRGAKVLTACTGLSLDHEIRLIWFGTRKQRQYVGEALFSSSSSSGMQNL